MSMELRYGEKNRAEGVARCLRSIGYKVSVEKMTHMYKVIVVEVGHNDPIVQATVTGFIYAYDRYVDNQD